MALKIKDISVPNYERVIHATNELTNLDCIIAAEEISKMIFKELDIDPDQSLTDEK